MQELSVSLTQAQQALKQFAREAGNQRDTHCHTAPQFSASSAGRDFQDRGALIAEHFAALHARGDKKLRVIHESGMTAGVQLEKFEHVENVNSRALGQVGS